MTTLEDVLPEASIFVTATGCCDILRPEHFSNMRDNAICCNIGHFDCEVDVAWLEKNTTRTNIKPQVWRGVAGGRCVGRRASIECVLISGLLF